MKTLSKLLPALAFLGGLAIAGSVNATVLFQDNFQTNLSQWSADNGQKTGAIVSAPGGGNALTLTGLESGNDMTTTNSFTSTTGSFTLSFQFETTTGHSVDSGAFIHTTDGWNLSDTPFNNNGTPTVNFTDSSTWETVTYTFAGSTTNLEIEDWTGSQFASTDTLFFRDLVLTDNSNGTPIGTLTVTPAVPEPASIALFGLGLLGVTLIRRRK